MKTQAPPVLSPEDAVSRNRSFEIEFTNRLCDVLGTPRASLVKDLLSKGDHLGITNLTVDPGEYDNPQHFAGDYLVSRILAKSMVLDTNIDTEAVARGKFFAAEDHNALTNARLFTEVAPSWVYTVSEQLLSILGPLDEKALNGIARLGDFGSGSAVGVDPNYEMVKSAKYDSIPVMTKELVPLWHGLAGPLVTDYWTGNERAPRVVQGNHHFTVPKDATTARNAAKEPLWNSFLQKGIGKHIERRLVNFGVDLHNQEWNQVLASLARVLDLVTVDLSQASDLMCRNAVWLLLCANGAPQGLRWYHLLDVARSKSMRIVGEDGKSIWRRLEMFSSMGNGFTFPLESAIFLAVIRSVIWSKEDRDHIAVYGDDMIYPACYHKEIATRLEYLGFKVNDSKTCLAGKFFESCGTDWFLEQSVRPFFLRQEPRDLQVIPYSLHVANSLRAWLTRVYGYCPSEFLPLWRWCKGQVPHMWNRPIPASLGMSGLWSTKEEWIQSSAPPKGGEEGRIVTHVTLNPETADRRSWGVQVAWLRAAGEGTADTDLSADGRNRLLREKDGLGPWLRSLALEYGRRPLPPGATLGREALRDQFGKPSTSKTLVVGDDELIGPWLP